MVRRRARHRDARLWARSETSGRCSCWTLFVTTRTQLSSERDAVPSAREGRIEVRPGLRPLGDQTRKLCLRCGPPLSLVSRRRHGMRHRLVARVESRVCRS